MMLRKPPPYRDLSATLHQAIGDDAAAHDARARIVRALAIFKAAGLSGLQAQRVERQHAIISRCDLGGELHKVVASDLGVSMRTFYRERFDGFKRLRHALAQEAAPATMVRAAGDGVALRIERAGEQVWLGRLREAEVRLEEVTVSAPPALAAVAFARLASVRVLRGDEERCTVALSRARRAHAILGPGTSSTVAGAEIDLVEALRLSHAGAFGQAATLYERIGNDLRNGAPHALDSARTALLGYVEALAARGQAAQALEAARRARERAGGDGASASFLAALDVAIAECALIMGGDANAAQEEALRIHAFASAAGAVFVAARALYVAAQAAAALLDRSGGLAHLRAALAIAKEREAGRLGQLSLLALAGSFAEMGDAEGALALVRGCAIGDERNDFVAGVARAHEAAALSDLGRYGEAVRRGREAVRVLSRYDSPRALGEAKLAAARATMAFGDPRAARALAVQAAKLLWGATWPTRVARTLRMAGRRATLRADLDPVAPSRSLGA